MLLYYQEVSFMLPYSSNRHHIHQSVSDLLSNCEHYRERPFIFDANTSDDKKMVITARGARFPENIPSSGNTQTFNKGDELSLKLSVPLVRRREVRHASGKVDKIQYAVNELEKQIELIQALLQRNGFDATKIERKHFQLVHVDRGGNNKNARFFYPVGSFEFTGKIVCDSKFSTAWLQGIGRHKGYGFGLMEFNSVNG